MQYSAQFDLHVNVRGTNWIVIQNYMIVRWNILTNMMNAFNIEIVKTFIAKILNWDFKQSNWRIFACKKMSAEAALVGMCKRDSTVYVSYDWDDADRW